MTVRIPVLRLPAALALAAALLLLAGAGAARADQAYDKVAAAYAQSGGQLDPCSFTQAELEAAVRGIPPQIRSVVPDLRRAMVEGIAAHQDGDCEGRTPDGGGSSDAGAGGAAAPGTTTPTTTTPPVETTPAPDTPTSTTPGATDTGAAAPPPATTAPPPGAEPAPAPAGESASAAGDDRDLTPLWIALVALGALLLLALAVWGWARMRGWDPGWVARVRHSWGEAGYRTTNTWAEFTDWLRLGR